MTNTLDCSLSIESGPFPVPAGQVLLSKLLWILGLVRRYRTNYLIQQVPFVVRPKGLFVFRYSLKANPSIDPTRRHRSLHSSLVHQDIDLTTNLLICNVLDTPPMFTLSQDQTLNVRDHVDGSSCLAPSLLSVNFILFACNESMTRPRFDVLILMGLGSGLFNFLLLIKSTI